MDNDVLGNDLLGEEFSAAKAVATTKASETAEIYCVLNLGSMREKPRYVVKPLKEAERDAGDTLPDHIVFIAEAAKGIAE